MSEIRGEKLRFRKRDIVPLHALPSAQAEDPIIVHCPPPKRSIARRLARVLAGFLALWVVVFIGIYAVVESGTLDKSLAARAEAVMNKAVGPDFEARVGAATVRFSQGMEMSIEARDVVLVDAAQRQQIAVTHSVQFVLDPLALLGGRFVVREVVSNGISLDARLLPKREPMDLSGVRIDTVPDIFEKAFVELERIQTFLARGGLDRLRLGGLEVETTSVSGRPLVLGVDDIALERGVDNSLSIFGAISVNGQQTELTALTTNENGKPQSLTVRIADFRVTPFLLRRSSAGMARQGIDGTAELLLNAKRGSQDQPPQMALAVNVDGATFYSDGQPQSLDQARLNLLYDFSKRTVELSDSVARFGGTVLPLSGGVIDLDRLPEGKNFPKGFGVDIVVTEGRSNVASANEASLPFFLKGYGRYLPGEKRLQLDTLDVSSPAGSMKGKLGIRFGGTGPEIRFNAKVENMKTAAVKQFWPYWIADKPRKWVLENIYGGIIPAGTIDVFIPQNRLSIEPKPVRLDENELRIGFDIEDARLNLTGEIPPLRDVYGRFDMVGGKVDVDIRSAGSYFPSGRTVMLEGGAFKLAEAYDKPLMADIDVNLSGTADAVAELVSFKPIAALQRIGFKADDFTGKVSGNAKIRVGLVADQKPPAPVWSAGLTLDKVDIKKPFDGREVKQFSGKIDVDTKLARIEGDARVEDVPMEIRMVEPVEKNQLATVRERVIKAKLDNAAREKLVPGLAEIIDGPISVELSRIDDKKQSVSVDLKSANLTFPWVGWAKGQGIGAKAEFELMADGDGQRIEKFNLAGEGFGVSGEMSLNRSGLVAANLSRVKLSPGDEVALKISQAKGRYSVTATGASFDARSLISKAKKPSDSSGGSGGGASIRVEAQLDRVVGFGNEQLSGVSVIYAARGSRVTGVDFSGVTGRGQALVAKLRDQDDQRELTMTSSDAGAVVRFLDIYNRLSGGLANMKLTEVREGAWTGGLDLRNFQVDNEERLQSIVSTPAGADGQSLNSAVKRDIDVSSARFQRAFARLAVIDGTISVENGIVRGEQVGASFQGIIRDASGRIDMTGTFMPAYGLNRLFGELPVIGLILGNGRDRGLLGITFKLTGASDKPNLVINPLSIIAPGVFRQVFEFR
ncbi:hypothetical protein ACSV9I_03320 [Rhizobium sp. G187]|uniref:hypothetical protein n=1 Tax=Rhizobium sp. G187 TaxID=3451352 RepID=UPI003EE6E264